MTERFEQVGLDYVFRPAELPVIVRFERVRDRGDELLAQVVVLTAGGKPVVTRHVNLMASPTRGALAELIKELVLINPKNTDKEWRDLFREACETVIRKQRAGRPFMVIEGEMPRPAPPAWLCQGLLLKNKPNCWLGAASTGKSTLAKAMCAYYAGGYRFCDREMEQGTPLYLDWEDDEESFRRTVIDVCRNLGVWPLPRMLWRDMHGHRLRDQLETLAGAIDRERIGLIVLDAVAAAGGSTGEHMSWEAIALEMEECLGALPPVTILALDHVTGAEHRAHRAGAKPPVPIKARGAERKLEYFRNQWTLMPDLEAEKLGRHVVEWTHTKNNLGRKEVPFATEILHREAELSSLPRPLEVWEPEPELDSAEETKFEQLIAELATTSGRSPRELALQFDRKEPSDSRIRSVGTQLRRAVRRGIVERVEGHPVRYRVRRQQGDDGLLIPFPGSLA